MLASESATVTYSAFMYTISRAREGERCSIYFDLRHLTPHGARTAGSAICAVVGLTAAIRIPRLFVEVLLRNNSTSAVFLFGLVCNCGRCKTEALIAGERRQPVWESNFVAAIATLGEMRRTEAIASCLRVGRVLHSPYLPSWAFFLSSMKFRRHVLAALF